MEVVRVVAAEPLDDILVFGMVRVGQRFECRKSCPTRAV